MSVVGRRMAGPVVLHDPDDDTVSPNAGPNYDHSIKSPVACQHRLRSGIGLLQGVQP
jgi:hypothetical protein